MKKIKHEAQLLKKALEIGEQYARTRGYDKFGTGTSPREKVECIYRLLVMDKLIHPLAKDQEDGGNMKHKLILWISRHLPKDHPLLN